jgi:uncharacterized protein YndB with AHSA1/START domain
VTAQKGMPQMGATDVRVEATVEAPIAHAFEVFTTRCDSWWPRAYRLGQSERSDVVIEPRVGGRWYEHGADGSECDWGQVLAWEPPHHLALSWQIGVNWAPEPDPARASRVDVRFVADGPTRTTVTVVHSDFERHGPGWESMRDGVAHEGGWPGILATYAEVARAEG